MKHPALHRVLLAAMTASDKSYLAYMAARLLEMHRILKPTGSIYLHCDPTMSHYLKLVMDAIFRPGQFLNEITWRRASSHNDTKQGMHRAGKVHDILLFYRKNTGHTWNPEYTPYTEGYLESEYRSRTDDSRYFKQTDPTAAKPGGDTEYEWRVKRPRLSAEWVADISNEHLNPQNGWEYKAVLPYTGRYWAYSRENMRQFWDEGRLHHRNTGMPRLMQFADSMPGIPLQDVWDDISPALGGNAQGSKRKSPSRCYGALSGPVPTKATWILDPFCGCATACLAAHDLQRGWAGIDISPKAAELVQIRMRDELGILFTGAHRTDIPQRTDLGQIIRFNDLRNRKMLYGEQGGRCAGCDGHFERRHLEVDHIIARGKG